MIRLKKLLKEIGEATGPKYKWKKEISGDLNKLKGKQGYSFVTDSGLEYWVALKNKKKFIDVDFEADESYDVTNRGEMFSVMATIVDIVKSALEGLNTGSDSNNSDVLGIKYAPFQKGGDMGAKRNNLYIAYIKKAIPNTEIIHAGGYTFVKFK
jgi:hypothetical protein